MAEITVPLDAPYSGGLAASSGSLPASSVVIDGRAYLLDTLAGTYRRSGVEVVQQRNTSDARDVLLLPQGIWRQSQSNWSSGGGQSNLDRDDAIQSRFYRSYGVDPWDRWQLSLLNQTAVIPGTDALTGSTWLTTWDSYLAVINDETIYWHDSVSASVSASVSPNPGHAIVDIANTGHIVTTLHDDGKVYVTDGPLGTPTHYHTHTISTPSFIAWEKDYLIAGDGNELINITNSGAPVSIYTHPDSDFRWVSAASGQSCIYVLGGLGDRWVVHRVNIKDDGTGLNPAIVAATLPDGEIGYSIDSYLGFVFIGTSKGVRMAQASDSGDLTLGPILPTSTPVRCFEGQDRFVWYGNEAVDGAYVSQAATSQDGLFPAGSVVGLSRMDLTTFTVTTLTPAYASDLVAESVASGTVRSVVTFAGKRVFSVDGEGVFYETDVKMPGGWLEQGIMSFSVEDTKTALYMQAKWLPLDGSIYVDLSYDSSPYRRLGSFTTQGSIRSDNINLNGTTFSRVESRYVLVRDAQDTTLGPILTRWELRASPIRGKASRWFLPIMNYEELDIDGVTINRNPLDEYNTLMVLVEQGPVFTYSESGQSYQVVARDFEWKPEKLTTSGKAWQGVFTLVIEEVR